MTDNQGGGIRSQNGNAIIRFGTFVSDTAQNLSYFSFDETHSMNVGNSVLFTSPGSFIDNCHRGDKPISSGYNIINDDSSDDFWSSQVESDWASLQEKKWVEVDDEDQEASPK